ncbi:helix-turn-helix transcriptional regulator [Streptomyces sp. NBC_00322]|uniref:helix-turn-helix domain-containing protein n=1 Tax=Streptomyces sp. NBC_00322 TaxID=2975712 RepID=UPI002E2E007B|nr:helix-turn-helix transcriptional regulator [Streptomyces sp. NBC_00322]
MCPYEGPGTGPFDAPWDRSRLTDRERQGLLLLGGGLSNRALSLKLGIAERTVKAHISRIRAKLGQTSRLRAAVISVLAHDRLCPDPRCTRHLPPIPTQAHAVPFRVA